MEGKGTLYFIQKISAKQLKLNSKSKDFFKFFVEEKFNLFKFDLFCSQKETHGNKHGAHYTGLVV